jgi:hypothetical protein
VKLVYISGSKRLKFKNKMKEQGTRDRNTNIRDLLKAQRNLRRVTSLELT